MYVIEKPKIKKTMRKMNRVLCSLLLAFSIIVSSGCGTQSKKAEEAAKKELSDQLLKEQNDLYAKACQDLTGINQKVIELNDKIHSMKEKKLTEIQNKSIDEFEEKRASINTRMRGLKNVTPEDWEDFKTKLENDIDEAKVQIDEILSSIK